MTTAIQNRAAETALTPLGQRTAHYVAKAKAEATSKAYASDLADLARWCAERGATSSPVGADTLAGYITELADAGAATSTIERRVASVSATHRKQYPGEPNPARSELVRETLAGIKRDKGTAPAKKRPMLLDDLRAFCHALPDDLSGTRDRAILAILFAGARRRSEVAALKRADVRFTAREMVVTVRRSKTDQIGAGHTIRIPSTDSDVCAVKLTRAWVEQAGITSGALFRRITRGVPGANHLAPHSIGQIVKHAAALAGMDATEFGGHSGRSGFVTEAFNADVPEADIMLVTDHKSQTIMRGYRRVTGREQSRAVAAVMGAKS